MTALNSVTSTTVLGAQQTGKIKIPIIYERRVILTGLIRLFIFTNSLPIKALKQIFEIDKYEKSSKCRNQSSLLEINLYKINETKSFNSETPSLFTSL